MFARGEQDSDGMVFLLWPGEERILAENHGKVEGRERTY